MTYVRRYPGFFVTLTILGFIAAAEVLLLCSGIGTATVAAAEGLQRSTELGRLAATLAQGPDAEAIDRRFQEIEAELGRRLERWRRQGMASDKIASRSRTDGFFELAAFADRMRDQARRYGVGVESEERFGFAAYAETAPGSNQLAFVLQQQQVLESVLQPLWSARPKKLLKVQCERPPVPESGATGSVVRADPASMPRDDFAEHDPRLRVRVPDACKSLLFRIEFVGDTSALRAFLVALAASEAPQVVRAVEVRAADDGSNAPGKPAGGKILVRRGDSTFAVTVEVISFRTSEAKGV